MNVPPTTTTTKTSSATTDTVTVTLQNIRPQPSTVSEQFWSLWNDKRSVVSLIRDNNKKSKDDDDDENENATTFVPYCLVSDEFVVKGGFRFQVLLYPRGVYSSTDQPLNGTPASAYLSFLPKEYGEEVDVCWKLRLINGKTKESLSVETSGGLPKSTDTWSAAMTFCSQNEAVDSVGRTADWGSSIWNSQQVCDWLDSIEAEVEISIMDSRQQQSSFAFPPKGGLGAAQKAMMMSTSSSTSSSDDRIFRSGEVIVMVPKNNKQKKELEQFGIYSGIDYRVMTMTDMEGQDIFTTESLATPEQRSKAKLALRPVGWKLQQQMWDKRGWDDWPIEVTVDEISSIALSRFNIGATIPRFGAFFEQDLKSFLVALVFALAPIPLALVGREFISFYAIPSASMDPTLRKGDVLVVEKFPGIFSRTNRGDIVLFNPPSALEEIIYNSGSTVGNNQLFVKRLVGMPGDTNIIMKDDTQEVTIGNNVPAVGPSRDLCDDEPLRLIDKLLDTGKGKSVESLGDDETYVLGDCKAVSVDSRVFGTLPKKKIDTPQPHTRLEACDRETNT